MWQRFFFGEPSVIETFVSMEEPDGVFKVSAEFVPGTGALIKVNVTNTTGRPHELIIRRSGGAQWKNNVVQPAQALEHLPALPVTLFADIESITARMA